MFVVFTQAEILRPVPAGQSHRDQSLPAGWGLAQGQVPLVQQAWQQALPAPTPRPLPAHCLWTMRTMMMTRMLALPPSWAASSSVTVQRPLPWPWPWQQPWPPCSGLGSLLLLLRHRCGAPADVQRLMEDDAAVDCGAERWQLGTCPRHSAVMFGVWRAPTQE